MKKLILLLFFVFFLALGESIHAQFANGNRFGRQRSAIPQAQAPPQEPEKLTAEEYVDQEMPKLKEVMDLDPFEEAVVRSVLINSIQKRMELQILQLEPEKMKEELQKISKQQNAELKAGLPDEKYQTYLELIENPSKTKRKKKKEKRKKKKQRLI